MPDLTETDAVVGTIPYLSPEILEVKSISEKSDIWAFGVVLYEMLIGERPFQGDHAGTLMRAILFDDVPDLEAIADGIPIAVIDLIYRMLEKDPMFRIPSVRLVGVELEALKKGYVPYTPRQLKRDEPTEFIESRFSTPTPSHHILNNLPSALTPFVGREAELKEIERLLSTERLVSIVAPGGMGKTRLALEAANGQLGQWADGVYFVDLAPISAPDAIPGKIAEATGFQFYEGVEPRDQILSFLREKQMLLVMDNYEHLLDGVDMVSDVLQTAPNVSIIATSRERLHLQGETLFTITGMEFPDWETPEDALDYAAVKLFMQSARRTNPAFELREEDLKYISRICRLVNGMPLGILLAASWTNILTPEEIAGEIEQSLDFLETDQRNVPERQRSIRAVFDYSWQRLSQREQDIFAAMSVFRGGFTRDAAQAVTGAGLRDLMSLVGKSMIARQPGGRYTIHELMRQYAAEQLGKNEKFQQNVHISHCRYYMNFLAQRESALKSSQELATLSEIEPEMENIASTWFYGVSERLDDLLGDALEAITVGSLSHKSNSPLVELLRYALDKVDGHLLGRIAVSLTHYRIGELEMYARIDQVLSTLSQETTPASEFVRLLGVAGRIYDDESFLKRATDIARRSDDPWVEANALMCWRDYERSKGNFARAKEYAYKVIESLEALGNRVLLVRNYIGTSIIEANIGNVDAAIAMERRTISMARELESNMWQAISLNDLAHWLAQNGQFDEAISTIKESIALERHSGRHFGIYAYTDTYASILYKMGRYEQALELFKQCQSILETELPQNVPDIASSSNRLGFVEIRLGNLNTARQHFVDALNYLVGLPESLFLTRLNSVIGLAHLANEDGAALRALILLYVVARYPMFEGLDSYINEARELTAKLEAELSPEEIELARQQAETYDLDTLIEELLAEYS